ncbi:MAG: immunoglobulin domain-containing protein, partial [Bacteroidales bacterium]|nr:immunoglobulin domain-containing protein [Bacteroidales bacterium]
MANTVIISLDKSIPEDVHITPSKPGFLCVGEEVTLQAPEGPGLNYNWYKDDASLPDQTSTIATSDSGYYKVRISKGSLVLESPSYHVEVRAVPESLITASGDLTFCEGNSVTLTANDGEDLTYSWLKDDIALGIITQSLLVEEEGSYTLIANNQGCSATSEPVIVTVLSATDPQCSTGIEKHQNVSRVYPNPF